MMNGISNRLLLSLIVVVAVLLIACTGNGQSGLPSSQSVAKSALEKEAQQAAEEFLKRAYYKCGDSYFMRQQAIKWPANSPYPVDPRPVYTQIKGLEWKVKGQEIIAPPLTEAERLNGVTRSLLEWKGEIVVTGRVFRQYDHESVGAATSESDRQRQLKNSGKWGIWNDIGVGPLTRFTLTKENGKWAVGDGRSTTGAISPKTINPVDCAAIPEASLNVSQVRDQTSPSASDPNPTVAQSQSTQKPSSNPPDTRQLTYGDPGSKLSIPEVRKPEPTDYSRIFSGKEVDSKARVLAKPQPTYTEAARKNQITGTVVLRAVFSSSGQVTNIHAVSGLPDGLTERAIAAAKQIRFIPAQKDGHPVSMWMELQYNFNGY